MKVKFIRRILIFPIISLMLFNLVFLIEDQGYSIPRVQLISFIVLVFLFFSTYFFGK